ncbi:MAG: EAL domain-containing protein [Burkholderiales bacterium]|nr:EAL domain-containing protein [Burkholderiales bacterium]
MHMLNNGRRMGETTRFNGLRPLLALSIPIAASILQWLLWPVVSPYSWFLFYPAVFISSWIGGRVSGLLASALSTCLVWWFFISPEYAFFKGDAKDLLAAAMFFGMGVLFSLFNGRLRRANQQAAAALAVADKANGELQDANTRVTQLYEKAKEIDDLKTQFFANVSHELRTPLALILGPVSRMQAVVKVREFANDLDVIERNARTLLRYVNDLLDISKLEAGKLKVEYAHVDLARLAHFVASHFEVLAQEKKIAFALEAPVSLPGQIDPDKVRRVVINLLSNAFKFTPDGGKIRIAVRSENDRAVIEVGDSGPGIPPDKREAVFERFRQLDGGSTRQRGGVGLGLSIAREFIALHGGTVTIADAPEGGALFAVSLPLRAPVGVAVSKAATEPPEQESMQAVLDELRSHAEKFHAGDEEKHGSVLIVEDNREMNRFICESLTNRYRITTAFDGEEGLKKALEVMPDLILTDMMMPGMSGEQLVHAVRAHAELDETAIVILTAKEDDELRIRMLREGAQDFLTKPFAVEELRARVGTQISRKIAVEALRQSEGQFRQLVEQAPEGIFVADLEGRYTDVNGAGCRMLGYLHDEILGKTIMDLIPPEDIDRLWRAKQQEMAGVITTSEWTLRHKNGSYIPVEVSAKILPGGRWQAFVRDITERKQAEIMMRQAAIVFNSTKEGIMITDADTRIIAANQALEEITGFKNDEIIGETPHFQTSGRQDKAFYRRMWEALQNCGHWQGELWNRRKNGEIFPDWENISVVKDAAGKVTHYVAVLSDISSIKQAEDKLSHLAHHDALTGLPNRLLYQLSLEKSLEQAKRHKRKVALLFLDLDRFKMINDTLGHAAGDRLLQEVANRLQGCVRSEDLVARLGGDEFTVTLEGISHAEDAAHLAEKIIEAVARPIAIDAIDASEVSTSTSVGIGLYPDDADNVEDLAKAADAAMYRAKDRGRNTYQFYADGINSHAKGQLALESALRRALTHGELMMYYQPQFDVVSGTAVGMEALLRWQHPEHGFLTPERFIAVAEESDLISIIGDWVVRQVYDQARDWIADGLQLPRIAINISGRQILYNDIFDVVQSAQRDSGLQPADVCIELEITETVLQSVQSMERNSQVLERLRSLGIQIALDDFGTGYSSLSRLKHLPIDTLKIDRAFVRNIPEDTNDKAITAAIVAMGHSLGLKVIAEGVETGDQLDFLRDQGCDEVQGYLLGGPVSAMDMGKLLSRREPHALMA